MKRSCIFLLLISVIPMSLFANSYSLQESGGSVNLWQNVKLGAPLQLNGGKIVSMQGPGVHLHASSIMGNLGSLKLGNGKLIKETMIGSKESGSITEAFTYGGGTISIVNSLKNALPKGAVFSGTLTAETLTVTYDYIKEQNSKGRSVYVMDGRSWQLAGSMLGKLYTGQRLTGKFDIAKAGKTVTGNASLSGVPEPRTLALLATGLLGIAGLIRSRRA